MAPLSPSLIKYMTDANKRTRLETKSLLIGYAMSRLDEEYLAQRKLDTWRQAFSEASQALSEPAANFKNLRDEFDPVHQNPRQGWHKRKLRPNRERIMNEFAEVSDDALMEVVSRILQQDEEAIIEAIDALAVVNRVPANVAERLLTGRRAEEYFLQHCFSLIDVHQDSIIDLRQSAGGFDFGVQGNPQKAIEVKGLKPMSGSVLFTDREWLEAKFRQDNYYLIVVGNLISDPVARVICNPYHYLQAICTIQTSVSAVWRSKISVQP